MHDDDAIPGAVWWFALEFSVGDLPAEWGMRPDAQKDISAYELLAQGILLVCRARMLPPCRMQLELRSAVDNTAAEAVGNKLFTTAAPMKHVARSIALWAAALRVVPDLQHIAGDRNDLADGLSRGHSSALSVVSAEQRVPVSLLDFVACRGSSKLCPPEAKAPAALAPLLAQ